MIEKIKTPVLRALRHPKETGALLLSGLGLTGPAVQPTVARAERSQNQPSLANLAEQTTQSITSGQPVEAAWGTLTVPRKVHNAGPHHDKTRTVYDHISYPLVALYRPVPGFVNPPNEEDILDGQYAFGTMTIKHNKPVIKFIPYDPNTMNFQAIVDPEANDPYNPPTTENIVFQLGEYNAPQIADLQDPGYTEGGAFTAAGTFQKIGHVTTTLHP